MSSDAISKIFECKKHMTDLVHDTDILIKNMVEVHHLLHSLVQLSFPIHKNSTNVKLGSAVSTGNSSSINKQSDCPSNISRTLTSHTVINKKVQNLDLIVHYSNVRSMFNKISLINQHLIANNVDLLFLTETWLHESILDSMVKPKDYELIRHDRRHSKGGGVALLYKSHLKLDTIKLEPRSVSSVASKFEYVCVDLVIGKSITRFCCTYIPPSSSLCSHTIAAICTTLQDLMTTSKPFFLLGDFNLPYYNWNIPVSLGDNSHDTFLSFCLSNGLTQNITEPTHIKGNTLDLLFCNMTAKNILLSFSVDQPLSLTCDHNVVSFKIQLLKPLCNSTKKAHLNFHKANFNGINRDLSYYDWTNLFYRSSNFQQFYNLFIDILTFLVSKYVPTNKFKSGRTSYPSHIKKLLRDKTRLYTESKANDSLKKSYKAKCKEYDKAVSTWHDSKELNLCSNPFSRKFYKFVKTKLNSRSTIPPLLDGNNILLTSDSSKAEFLNMQFQSFFVKDDNTSLFLPPKLASSMDMFTITRKDIALAIDNMKDRLTRTPEGIPSYFIKRCFQTLAEPLHLIFNHSLKSSDIPIQWKQAIVVPVFKKGSRNNAKNYRPISLTSSFCRLFESILTQKIVSHLLLNNLLSPNQFGFLPNRSSCGQLLSCIHKWIVSLSNNRNTSIVYTDIRKAFDTVSHPKLISCLKQYKLNFEVTNWIKIFLNNRTQQVALNDILSSPLPVYSGVPQGSIVGPLLFLIFFNDIAECSPAPRNSSSIMLFADDAKIFNTDPVDLQHSLNFLNTWLNSRQLQLACEKCFILNINKRPKQIPQTILKIDNQQLSSEVVAKDLGVFITQDLKWDYHISYLYRISSQVSYQIRKTFKTKNIWTLLKLYSTYIRPKLEYNTPVWSPYLKKDILKLESVQKLFTKYACLRCSVPFTSYKDRLLFLNLNTLEYRRVMFDLVFLFKIIKGQTNLNFSDFFIERNLPFSLRGSKLKITSLNNFHTSQWQGSFFGRIATTWNSLPDNITSADTLPIFKRRLNNFDLKCIVKFTVDC